MILSVRALAWEPSAIAKLNGEDAIKYLSQFAALNPMHSLEPHADCNQLASGQVLEFLGSFTIVEGDTTICPGEIIALTFENGTQLEPEPWLADYHSHLRWNCWMCRHQARRTYWDGWDRTSHDRTLKRWNCKVSTSRKRSWFDFRLSTP